MDVKKDLVYHESYGLKTDLYLPDDEYRGVIVDLHGGGWFRGDKSKDEDLALEFVAAGYVVAVPNYRYTPEVYFPVPIMDVFDLVMWLNQKQGFALSEIGVFGSSAGGNLAVELAIKIGIPAASWSGILDIDQWIMDHQSVVAKPDTTQDFTNAASATINQTGKNDSFYKWFVMNYLQNKTELLKSATPWRRINKKTGPLLLANSEEEFVPTSGVIYTQEQMAKFDLPIETYLLPGTAHAKGYHDQMITPTLAFFAKYLQTKNAD